MSLLCGGQTQSSLRLSSATVSETLNQRGEQRQNKLMLGKAARCGRGFGDLHINPGEAEWRGARGRGDG